MQIKRVTVLLLTLIILLADSGHTIYAHTCLKTKHTHISVGQPKHCCSEKVTRGCDIKKASCCEVSSKVLKVNFVTNPAVTDFPDSQAEILCHSQLFNSYVGQAVLITSSNSSPPVACGKSACAFTQTFRI